jgi:hypothetical protein
MTVWLAEIARGEAVPDGLSEWSAAYATFADAWRECQRPDWMMWMASRHNPSEAQQRRIIEVACGLGEPKRRLPIGTLRPTLTEHQLAAEWASAGDNDAEYVFGDFFNALLASALLLIPILVFIYVHWSNINPWRRNLYGDLITIPACVLFAFVSFVALRRLRRANTARRLRDMTWERARAVAFARILPAESPRTAAVIADTLREHAADFTNL